MISTFDLKKLYINMKEAIYIYILLCFVSLNLADRSGLSLLDMARH